MGEKKSFLIIFFHIADVKYCESLKEKSQTRAKSFGFIVYINYWYFPFLNKPKLQFLHFESSITIAIYFFLNIRLEGFFVSVFLTSTQSFDFWINFFFRIRGFFFFLPLTVSLWNGILKFHYHCHLSFLEFSAKGFLLSQSSSLTFYSLLLSHQQKASTFGSISSSM